MKKTSLLVLAALSLCGSMSAEEYWVIKDGVLSESITQMPYDQDGILYDTLISDQTYDGEKVAAYIHRKNDNTQYRDVRLDLSLNPIDFSKTWVMKIEYAMPYVAGDETKTVITETSDYALGKKADMIFGFDGVQKEKIDVTAADAMFTIQGSYLALQNGGAWNTREQFVFVNPSITTAELLILSYLREASVDLTNEPLYIKNLSFIGGEGEYGKPLYAEDFTNVGAAIYSDNSSSFDPTDASVVSKFHGGIVPLSEAYMNETATKNYLDMIRIWDVPYDASGISDAEIYHSLLINPTYKDPVYINDIEIPAGVKEFEAKMLIKKRWLESEETAWNAATDDQRVIPVSIKFDNQDEYMPLFADSLMQGFWSWEIQKVTVPSDAKSCSIKFDYGEFAYIIDQVRLGEDINVGVEDFKSNSNISVYFDSESNAVYAKDAIQVDILSMTGATLASSKGNSVNVSSLAAGSYIVKAYFTDGVAAKAIVIKK